MWECLTDLHTHTHTHTHTHSHTHRERVRTALNSLHGQAAWLLKIRALVEETYTDEAELDEEGMGELLMDDNATAQIPRACVCACEWVTFSI
jgi:hypothetical protein